MTRVRYIICPCGWSGAVPYGPIILCPRCGGTDWRGETNAETIKRLRAGAVAQGLCYQCRLHPVKPGTRYCPGCLQRSDDYIDSIRYRKCQTCGKDVRKRKRLLCRGCSAKYATYQRVRAAAAVANNLCPRCEKHPSHPDRILCALCLDENKDRVAADRRAQGAKPRHVCSICTELGIVGAPNHNRMTHDRIVSPSTEAAISLA